MALAAGSETARRATATAAHEMPRATDAVVSIGTRLGDEVAYSSKRVAGRAGELRKLTDDVLVQTSQRVREDVLPQVAHMLPQVAEAVRQEVVPTVTHAAEAAVTTVADAAATRRKQLAEAAKKAREEGNALADDVAAIANSRAKQARRGWWGRKKAAPAPDLMTALGVTGAVGLAASQAAQVSEQSRHLSRKARAESKKAAERAQRASQKAARDAQRATTRAAGNVGGFIGDTTGTLFWLAALLGLLFYAFASEEQRETFINGIKTAYEQATELYRDFQGYSEEI
jgi:hypothetical protein